MQYGTTTEDKPIYWNTNWVANKYLYQYVECFRFLEHGMPWNGGLPLTYRLTMLRITLLIHSPEKMEKMDSFCSEFMKGE